ncbi:MAG: hypothetical protein LKG48_04630 [Lachnospiraceae bacterium]|jgi:hypothetical protein|nr:hypothetical protein [Lachnospiraceae bacterium]MCH4104307.1 hypothetical protein [Lachnospiraceae bacterium]MCI1309032.1 hypothetical protein [Lachnospiraceae bacterium]MCI1357055.1 hypothetical protein [Lachnospiraceae bacterium]MCI1357123.1 hypothetical protein [Lachnospiraceae bacterium]
MWVSILLAFLLGLFIGGGVMIFCISLCHISGLEDHAKDYRKDDPEDPDDKSDDQR